MFIENYVGPVGPVHKYCAGRASLAPGSRWVMAIWSQTNTPRLHLLLISDIKKFLVWNCVFLSGWLLEIYIQLPRGGGTICPTGPIMVRQDGGEKCCNNNKNIKVDKIQNPSIIHTFQFHNEKTNCIIPPSPSAHINDEHCRNRFGLIFLAEHDDTKF